MEPNQSPKKQTNTNQGVSEHLRTTLNSITKQFHGLTVAILKFRNLFIEVNPTKKQLNSVTIEQFYDNTINEFNHKLKIFIRDWIQRELVSSLSVYSELYNKYDKASTQLLEELKDTAEHSEYDFEKFPALATQKLEIAEETKNEPEKAKNDVSEMRVGVSGVSQSLKGLDQINDSDGFPDESDADFYGGGDQDEEIGFSIPQDSMIPGITDNNPNFGGLGEGGGEPVEAANGLNFKKKSPGGEQGGGGSGGGYNPYLAEFGSDTGNTGESSQLIFLHSIRILHRFCCRLLPLF